MTREEAIDFALKLSEYDITMYGRKVGVVRDEEDERGIIIPDTEKRKPIRGRLVYLGFAIDPTDREDDLAGIKIGDWIFHTKYNPTLFDMPFPDETIELEVMHASDIHMGVGRG